MNFALLSSVVSAASTAEETTGGGFFANYSFLILIAVMGVAMYFFMYRPNKKKEKEAKERKNSIEIGDEITTIGGIVGRVVSLKEDTFVIEIAGERTRMRFKRWAIQDVEKLDLEGDASDDKSEKSKKGE